MGELQQLVSLNQTIKKREIDEVIQEQLEQKRKTYAGDFKRFVAYCEEQQLSISFESLEAYLHYTIKDGLKLNTFNRRAAGVKHFLVSEYGLEQTPEQRGRIIHLRQLYNDKKHVQQKKVEGKKAADKGEMIQQISALDVRQKAITLFNLITASRPSEMILLKIGNIDLDNCSVDVYLQKQKEWHTKRLTPECVEAIHAYIKAFALKPEHYLVGAVDKHGNYTSKEVSDVAYRKMIKKWLECAPYTLRKTQISDMYAKGADLVKISKQTGHKSLKTITEHYLNVSDKTIDKFL